MTHSRRLHTRGTLDRQLSDIFAQRNAEYISSAPSSPGHATFQSSLKSSDTKDFIEPKPKGVSSRPLHITMQSSIKPRDIKGYDDDIPRAPIRPYNATMKSIIPSRNSNRYIEPPMPSNTRMKSCIRSSDTNGNTNPMPKSPNSPLDTTAQSDIKSPRLIGSSTMESVYGKTPTYSRRLNNKLPNAYGCTTGSNTRNISSVHCTTLQSGIKSPHLIASGRASMSPTTETISSSNNSNTPSEKISTHSDSLYSPTLQSDKKSLDFIAHVKNITTDGSVTSVYPTSSSDGRQTGCTETQDVESLDIPSLDLRLTDEQQSSPKYGATFTVNRTDPEEAFQKWLKVKKAQKIKEKKLKKVQEAKKREKEELRKVESKVKVQEWEERKRIERATEISKRNSLLKKMQKNEPMIKKTDSNMKVMEWEYTKMQLAAEKKQIEKAESELKKAQEEMRREQAAEAWNQWINKAKDKPKPVPLNRGLESLRGSLSKTYINPNEWQT